MKTIFYLGLLLEVFFSLSPSAFALTEREIQSQILLHDIEMAFPFHEQKELYTAVENYVLYSALGPVLYSALGPVLYSALGPTVLASSSAGVKKMISNVHSRVRVVYSEVSTALEKRSHMNSEELSGLRNEIEGKVSPLRFTPEQTEEAKRVGRVNLALLAEEGLELAKKEKLDAFFDQTNRKVQKTLKSNSFQRQVLLKNVENLFPFERIDQLPMSVQTYVNRAHPNSSPEQNGSLFRVVLPAAKKALIERTQMTSDQLEKLNLHLQINSAEGDDQKRRVLSYGFLQNIQKEKNPAKQRELVLHSLAQEDHLVRVSVILGAVTRQLGAIPADHLSVPEAVVNEAIVDYYMKSLSTGITHQTTVDGLAGAAQVDSLVELGR